MSDDEQMGDMGGDDYGQDYDVDEMVEKCADLGAAEPELTVALMMRRSPRVRMARREGTKRAVRRKRRNGVLL